MTYEEFTRNMKKNFGIDLSGYKVTQMKRRIEQLMERCQCGNYEKYIELLKADQGSRTQFVRHLTINVTEFFRNPDQFKYLEEKIISDLYNKSSSLRIWSAACSNGSEPYTLAILLDNAFPGKSFKIDATDIDDDMLKWAANGEYWGDYLKNISQDSLVKNFAQTEKGAKINKNLASHVSFKKHNLLEERYQAGYDLIVCRNVTIYFTPEAQEHCYQGFFKSLNSGGVLFTGASENILNYRKFGYERICPSFYRKP